MKKLPAKIALMSLSALLISACVGTPAYDYRKAPIVTEVAVPLGKTVEAGKTGLSVSFDNVESDSRCPINARCTWSGVAIVNVTVKNAKGASKPLKLSTVNFEAYNQVEKAFGKDFELVDLLPHKGDTGQLETPPLKVPTIKLKID